MPKEKTEEAKTNRQNGKKSCKKLLLFFRLEAKRENMYKVTNYIIFYV
jgi:hypothetical protein